MNGWTEWFYLRDKLHHADLTSLVLYRPHSPGFSLHLKQIRTWPQLGYNFLWRHEVRLALWSVQGCCTLNRNKIASLFQEEERKQWHYIYNGMKLLLFWIVLLWCELGVDQNHVSCWPPNRTLFALWQCCFISWYVVFSCKSGTKSAKAPRDAIKLN